MADEQKTDLAEVRTDFAEDRTVLANERTFGGWLRTGYAATGIGLAFNALFERVEPPWLPKLIATGFLAIAIVIFIGAERRACKVMARLHSHRVASAKSVNLRLLSIGSSIATAALIASIWLLNFQPPPQP